MSRRDEFIQVAKTVPYDDTIQTPLSGTEDVQAMLDYLKNKVSTSASPGFTWGRSGNVNANTWFLNDSVPSNTSGRICFLLNSSIEKVFIANEAATAGIQIEVYTHDGNSINLTLIGTVTTAAQRSNTFTVSYPVAFNKQIAIKLKNGSPAGKNMVIGCLIKGDLT
jgi:hypothetical protein